MSRKHVKTCVNLNYFQHFLVFTPAVSGCVSISAFTSLLGIPIGITCSAVGLKIYAVTAGIKNYKSIIKKKKKHHKIVLLAKAKLDTIEVQISKALIDSYINYDDFVSVNMCHENKMR